MLLHKTYSMMLKRTSQTNVVENLILNQYQWKHSIVVDLTTINRYNPFANFLHTILMVIYLY